MPTSSQYLILRANDGTLPPVFGRRRWRPDFSLASIDFTDRSRIHVHTRTPSETESFPCLTKRPGSAPCIPLDSYTLDDILKIHRLHGALRYDEESNSLHWKVPSQDIVQFSKLRRGWNPVPIKTRSTPKQHDKHQYRPANTVDTVAISMSDILSFVPRFGKTKKTNTEKTTTSSTTKTSPLYLPTINKYGRATELNCAKFNLKTHDDEKAEYFKLTVVSSNKDEPKSTFRIVRSAINEPGSLRLRKTAEHEVGDYCLVTAADEDESDFRLVVSDHEANTAHLLHAEPQKGQYQFVEVFGCESGEVHFLHGVPVVYEIKTVSPTLSYSLNNYNSSAQRKTSHTSTENAVNIADDASAAEDQTTHGRDTRTDHHAHYKTGDYGGSSYIAYRMSSENRYILQDARDYDINPKYKHDIFLPDISFCDSGHPIVLQKQEQKLNGNNDTEFSKDMLDNEMSEFREKYKDSYRKVSFGNYENSLRHGNDHNGPAKSLPKETENAAVNNKNYTGTEWRTHNFDEWSRTTDTHRRQSSTLEHSSQRDMRMKGAPKSSEEHKTTLIDEVKLKANYKQWKKSHITALRMRKELPASDRSAVCVTLRDNVISHNKLKQMVENSTKCTLTSLQFDPVSVHSVDTDAKSRWILRFSDPSVCEALVTTGISIEGEIYPVRSFDVAMKEEHEAYKYFLLLNEMKRRKIEKRDSGRRTKMLQNKKVATSHTQTSSAELMLSSM